MNRKLGINISDINIDYLRKVNDSNTSKNLTTSTPRPNVFMSPIPDNRDHVLRKMKKEMDKKLEVVIEDRNKYHT
jgi:hypothetical protein